MRRFFTLRPRRYSIVPPGINTAQSIGILLAQMLDFATTIIGLKLGAVEQNGAMSKLISAYGTDTFFAVKVAAAVVLIWFGWRRPVVAWSLSLLYYAVALWNLAMIYRLLDIVEIVQP